MIDPRIVAHRGFTLDQTENTLPALEAAIALGSCAVEFDVHATADGVWVVHHDPTLLRIHGIDLSIAQSALSEVLEWVEVATLAQALALFPVGCRPMVEVKPTEATHFASLAVDLATAAAVDPIVIVRGDLPRAAREAFPGVPIFLFEEDWDAAYARRDEPIDGYDLSHEPIPDDRIEEECARFAAAGKEVAVWTIDDPARAKRWLDAGVPWVITNRPDEWAVRQ